MTETNGSRVIHIDGDLHERIKAHCLERECTLKGFVELIIRRYLDKIGAPPPQEKKQLESYGTGPTEDLWTRPPFWSSPK